MCTHTGIHNELSFQDYVSNVKVKCKEMMILVILQIFYPEHIFKSKLMNFVTEALLSELFERNCILRMMVPPVD